MIFARFLADALDRMRQTLRDRSSVTTGELGHDLPGSQRVNQFEGHRNLQGTRDGGVVLTATGMDVPRDDEFRRLNNTHYGDINIGHSDQTMTGSGDGEYLDASEVGCDTVILEREGELGVSECFTLQRDRDKLGMRHGEQDADSGNQQVTSVHGGRQRCTVQIWSVGEEWIDTAETFSVRYM